MQVLRLAGTTKVQCEKSPNLTEDSEREGGNMKKSFITVLLVVMAVLCFTACTKQDESEVNVGVLKGPTGIGAVNIMSKSDKNEYEHYHFTLTPDVNDIVAQLTNGDLDIGALPTNTAANLYNKLSGDVELIALNCTGVLYIMENGNSVNSVSDLKGKTIYVNGQGSNPEYVLNFLLKKNGLEPGIDVDVQFRDASEISAMMISGEAMLCMLPVPAVTTICVKNPDVRKALDITEEYAAAANDGSSLTMGCLVARKDFVSENPEAVELFLDRYRDSIEFVLNDTENAAELVAEYEITGNADIARRAIPDCGIVCITGGDIRPTLEGYLQVLYDAAPASIGGKMPGDDFYGVKK